MCGAVSGYFNSPRKMSEQPRASRRLQGAAPTRQVPPQKLGAGTPGRMATAWCFTRSKRCAQLQNISSRLVLTSPGDFLQPRPNPRVPLLSRCAGFVLCVLLTLLVVALPVVCLVSHILPCCFLRGICEGSPGFLVVLINPEPSQLRPEF